MRSVSLRLVDLSKSMIPIGFVDENLHTQVRIDCKKMFDEYPTAIPSLTVSPPEGSPYPAIATKEGDYVVWDITSSDCASEGTGEIQLTFVVGEIIAKSYIGRIRVTRSLNPAGEIPDPVQDWITQANAVLAEIPETISTNLQEIFEEAKESGELKGDKGDPGEPGNDGYTPVKGVDYFDGEPGQPGAPGQNGAPGQDGDDGVTFTPSVSAEGVISWTNDGGRTNPENVNIKGPKGDTGDPAPAEDVADAVDAYLEENFSNPSNPPLDRSLTSALSAAPADMVGDLKSATEALDADTVHLVVGKNKFNKNDSDVAESSCIISDGTVLSNQYTTNYYATGYIPVEENKEYLWTDYNIGSTMALAFYNSSKTCIGYIPGGGSTGIVATDGKFTTITGTAFIRTTGVTANIATAMLVEGTIAGSYEAYQKVNPVAIVREGNHVKRIEVFQAKQATLSTLALTVPNLKQKAFTFTANCSTVGTLTIANGLRLAYKSSWILINDTKVIVRSYRWTGTTTGEVTELDVAHGLTLAGGYMSVVLKHNANKTAEIILAGKTGKVFRTGFYFEGCADDVTAYNYQGSYSDVTLTMYCEHYKKDVWAYGDSYFDMWPLKAIPMGATNVMYDAYTGRNSAQALTSLQRSLQICSPKKILWCMGMNDPDGEDAVNASWKSVFDAVKSLCDDKGIELIGCTVPNTPTMENSYKNAVIKASGLRYVDVAASVGASSSGSSWYTGMLSADNVHPTDLGREVIASVMIASVPEILTDEIVTAVN